MTTRADIETILVSRASPWLTSVGMAVTFAGANASLNDAIGWAIRQTDDGTVAALALVTDADVATVASADLDLLLDLAELRMLESILSNFSGIDLKAGPVEIKDSQFGGMIERRIAQLRSWLSAAYGIGGGGAFSVSLTRTDGYSDLQATLDAA